MLEGYSLVNLFEEFGELNNIEKLDKFFKENNWNLIKRIDENDKKEYYQLYFGKDVQVDNMYEYGFSYSFDKERTQKELNRFIEYRLEEYRYYVYDFLIGQEILTIDKQEKKYRIDGYNIHGQCFSLDREWHKITKANINRALRSSDYAIDKYFLEHFVYKNSIHYAGYNDKDLLFKSNNYDDCIMFLVNFGKENNNCTNNQNFDYYKKYLSTKEEKEDNVPEEIESYEETITSTKDIKDGISYTVARVLEGNYCVELHYCSDTGATVEYGTKVSSDTWENEIEEVDWFNTNLNDDYILIRLNYLYDEQFLNINLSPEQAEELNLIDDILYKHKVYDIELSINNNGNLVAFDDKNYWVDKDFYDFIFDELFVYNREGEIESIDKSCYQKLLGYREKYLVAKGKSNEVEMELEYE